MKAVIVGKGYVGNSIFNQLTQNDYFETVELFSRSELDYSDPFELRRVVNKDTVVINAAGFTGRPNVDEGEIKKELCWDLNVKLPLTLNKVCRDIGASIIHITSGCIYTGYEKDWEESDEPNFGMFSNDSSFYSKSKHAFESISDYGLHLRVRMPFCDALHERSFLTKILNYNNLVNTLNSKTYVPELCRFIEHYITEGYDGYETINFCNRDPLSTEEIVDMMKERGIQNDDWTWENWDKIPIKANRSNCVMDTTKVVEQYEFNIISEYEALSKALDKIAEQY